MEFIFEKSGHKYYVDGVELPSVSQIIGGSIPLNIYTMQAMNKGTAVHKMLEDLDNGIVVDNVFTNFWKQYLAENNYKVDKIEFRFYAHLNSFYYAGCIDRLLVDSEGNYILLDFKTGKFHKKYNLQMVAYKHGLEQFLDIKISKCILLFLKEKYNQEYVLPETAHGSNLFIFKSLLSQYYEIEKKRIEKIIEFNKKQGD